MPTNLVKLLNEGAAELVLDSTILEPNHCDFQAQDCYFVHFDHLQPNYLVVESLQSPLTFIGFESLQAHYPICHPLCPHPPSFSFSCYLFRPAIATFSLKLSFTSLHLSIT